MKIGISTNGVKPDSKLFEAYKKGKMDAMEIGFYEPESANAADWKEIKRLADEYGIKLWSFHAPFYPFEEIDLSSTDEVVREHTVQYFKELVEKISEVGIDKMVVHPSGEPIDDGIREKKKEACKKSLYELAEFAETKNVVIAVEDLPRTCLARNFKEIEELISVHENVKICFDTNHLLNEDHSAFIERVGKDIVTLHVSDYDFVDERHWMPKKGKINWDELISGLNNAGYDGVWMYEIRFDAENLSEFFDNAKSLNLY